MSEEQLNERIADLERELRDEPNIEALMRKVLEARTKHDTIVTRLGVLRTVPGALASLDAKITEERKWLDHLTAWKKTLHSERAALLVLKHPSDREVGLIENLTLSLSACESGTLSQDRDLESLRIGDLMRSSGFAEGVKIENQVCGKLPWSGSIIEGTRRIATLTERMSHLQAQLNDAILTDALRQQQDVERREQAAERMAKPQRKTRGLSNDGKGESQYDQYPDGRVEEVQRESA